MGASFNLFDISINWRFSEDGVGRDDVLLVVPGWIKIVGYCVTIGHSIDRSN